jgi:hypothetical protein
MTALGHSSPLTTIWASLHSPSSDPLVHGTFLTPLLFSVLSMSHKKGNKEKEKEDSRILKYEAKVYLDI